MNKSGKQGAATLLGALVGLALAQGAWGAPGDMGKPSDSFQTSSGTLEIVFIGHGSLLFLFNGMQIYVDPVRQYADYSKFPKADYIFITHEHGDHLDAQAIGQLRQGTTRIYLNEASRAKFGDGNALEHGGPYGMGEFSVRAVPAYNVTPGRTGYHPRERRDNGYIFDFGGLHVYVAGDTEPIPEMASLGHVDIAFLPMNLPFTMTPEQVAEAARLIKPRVLYPYHYGNTDTALLLGLMQKESGIEVRIRPLQ